MQGGAREHYTEVGVAWRKCGVWSEEFGFLAAEEDDGGFGRA
jgi:hypothetical protein